jgi:hypothetical protein
MSISDLGAIGEFVGSIVVAVTVIILIFQVRQNTAALEATSESEVSRDFARFHEVVAKDLELVELFEKAQFHENMKDVEIARYRWLIAELFYICESAYKRFRREQLTAETWETYVGNLLGHLENPIIREWWDMKYSPFPQEFRTAIEEARNSNQVVVHAIPHVGARQDPE